MNNRLVWQYDESHQVGKDYSRPEEVEIYEATHANFRDLEQESRTLLDELKIGANNSVVDFGAGTGVFAMQAALRCAKVHAVDVSQAMIDYAKAKAARAGVTNIEFHHGGFLSYEHQGRAADALVTTFAFHHLPDFWKGVALQRMNRMLKSGGRLYINDVVLTQDQAIANITAFIDKQAAAGGDFLRRDAEQHFKEEFSTYDWIMDGLLLRAGFTIDSKMIHEGVFGVYLCTKHASDREAGVEG